MISTTHDLKVKELLTEYVRQNVTIVNFSINYTLKKKKKTKKLMPYF